MRVRVRVCVRVHTGQDWLEGQGGDEGEAPNKRVQGALALVKATLKYNGLSVEDGFAEFDNDGDGRITLMDVDGVVKSLAMELTGLRLRSPKPLP